MKARATLFLGLALASLLALSACSGTPSLAAQPTATPIPNATYTSTDGAYSLKYPGNWTTKEQPAPSTAAAALVSSPDGNDIFIIEPFTIHSAATPTHILQSAMSDSQFTGSKVDSATTTQSYPSGTWTVATGSTTANGIALSARLYLTEHAGHTVIIMTFAPTASASADQTKYFDPMLQSFTFVK